ncbi:TolC family protein [Polyangium sorediatum]|uniref:TolC family protein n=1 Tax=Polyangium sorediatum TaxID=889274 RepID=A0ABT6P3A4_9BACT|nr:TolC family protein [Polyangium sorediatum]MDI1435001.1 TolC family protein [Polyangium sorediatum]
MRRGRTGSSSSVAALAWLCFFAAGCIPSLEGNEPREPSKAIPASFGHASSTAGASSSPASSTQTVWRTFFDDAELRALIEMALAKNQELNIQLQEIIIARNEVSARQGDYLPKVGVGAGVGVERMGKNTSQGISDESHGLPQNLGDFTFGFWGSWEVDVWGKLRDATKSADLRYLATIEGRNFMVTQIVAEIASSYFELVAIDNQLDVLKRNVEILADALEIIKLEKQAARVTELAVQRFEAEVLKNKSRLYGLEQERVQIENKINFLVGRYPQAVSRNDQKLKDPLPKVTSGLPSDLLKNRPDIRQAELELQATKLDVQVAKAEFYPSLSIDAAVGYRSFNVKHLLVTPDSLIYNLAGNLTAPLLNRKAIEAQYRSVNARQLQAVFNYERTLLQAFTDVANQLSLVENLQKAYDLQAQQVEVLTRSSETSTVLFQSARADYVEVLLTRRDSLDAEMELIETKKRQWLAVVHLYQALGGGWRSGG